MTHQHLLTSIITVYILTQTIVRNNQLVPCVENGRFYRHPFTPQSSECSRYYLCLDGEVFDFRCSSDLVFDVDRQICAAKNTVNNCHVSGTTESTCGTNSIGCEDGTCLPSAYFCDGHIDCADGTDEKDCLNDLPEAPICDTTTCKLPHCFCTENGTGIPGGLSARDVPQLVVVTFNGAINYENWQALQEVFDGKSTNPNGCPIRATFFVSHLNNNYHQTQKMWNEEHEIGVHSITHRTPKSWWAHNATIEDWFNEMVGEANILHKFSSVRLSEIRGLRAPFFQPGWNRQFLMMDEFGFVYDSTVTAPFSTPPFWPYTLDFKSPHECINRQNCPSRTYPGLWEMVVNPLETDTGKICATLGSCPNLTGDDLYKTLTSNFNRHYATNRAPFGAHFHASSLKNSDFLEALQDFIAETLQQEDVWFVTNWQAISWVRNPTPLNKINTFKPLDCDKLFQQSEIACKLPNVCKLPSTIFHQDKYLYTCFKCPEQYPWIKNEFGLNSTHAITKN